MGTYKPFIKPNDSPVYVPCPQTQKIPPSITKNIPRTVNRRLSVLSSNQDMLDNVKEDNQELIENSGYKLELGWGQP